MKSSKRGVTDKEEWTHLFLVLLLELLLPLLVPLQQRALALLGHLRRVGHPWPCQVRVSGFTAFFLKRPYLLF